MRKQTAAAQTSSRPARRKNRLSMPDTLVLITALLAVVCVLTWVIPAGRFDMDGREIVAGSFHFVEADPATLWDFLNSFGAGMDQCADTIALSLILGGTFRVLLDTGTIHALLSVIIRITRGNRPLILACITFAMSVFGALGVGLNVQLAFAPIVLLLCRELGLDGIVAGTVCYMAANVGFSASPVNPLTVVLGQDLAGLTPMSGLTERLLCWVLFTVITTHCILRYTLRILHAPERSLTGVYAPPDSADAAHHTELTLSRGLTLLLLAASFAAYCWGCFFQGWKLQQLTACMMALALGSGLLGGMSLNAISRSFVEGAKSMTATALMIGFAGGISVIMSDANIIHTIVYCLCIPLAQLSSAAAAIGMFAVNFLLSFFVTSGSGQCYLAMPIMAPMADLLGISRQIAVAAFQLGDGLCNMLLPHSVLLMGTLSIAKVPFTKWLRFALPVAAILSAAACGFLAAMCALGWA